MNSPNYNSSLVNHMYYSNCKAVSTSICGGTLELRATGLEQSFNVENVRYYRSTGTYQSCYWHVALDYRQKWESGAVLRITPTNLTNFNFYMYGGNSRFNSSVTVNNNAALNLSIDYNLDISNDGMLVLVPIMD
jgi:hypothetical protein